MARKKHNQGEKHPRAKVSDKQVIEIMELKNKGVKTKDIAKIYDITPNHVSQICTKSHKHLKENKCIDCVYLTGSGDETGKDECHVNGCYVDDPKTEGCSTYFKLNKTL